MVHGVGQVSNLPVIGFRTPAEDEFAQSFGPRCRSASILPTFVSAVLAIIIILVGETGNATWLARWTWGLLCDGRDFCRQNRHAVPGELCRATIADVDRANRVITLKEHKTARKTGQVRRIPIGRKLGELLDQAIGDRTDGPVFLSPSGRVWNVGNLSRTYSRLRDQAGLPKDLVLYLARHECGTKICREKGIEYAR
jgi:integrase